MTQEAFIKKLNRKKYPYRIEGDKIIVTYTTRLRSVDLPKLRSLPPGVVFENNGHVWLDLLESLPPGVEFKNIGDVVLDSLGNLSSVVVFENRGNVDLPVLTSLTLGVEFSNEGYINLRALTSLPLGVEFKNGGDVYLGLLIGRWFNEWESNIEGIDSKMLLNVMIKQGVFI